MNKWTTLGVKVIYNCMILSHVGQPVFLKSVTGHLACVEVTLFLFPDVAFHLTHNYQYLMRSKDCLGKTHHHFSFSFLGIVFGC